MKCPKSWPALSVMVLIRYSMAVGDDIETKLDAQVATTCFALTNQASLSGYRFYGSEE